MTVGIDVSRVGEVIATFADGDRNRGSGFLLPDGYVLTAWHVVADATAVHVIFEAGSDRRWSSLVLSTIRLGNLDVAIVRLEHMPVVVDPIIVGGFGERGIALAADAAGFPRWKIRNVDGTVPRNGDGKPKFRAGAHVPARLVSGSNNREGACELIVDPPAGADSQASPWEGMSGGPVFCDGSLVAVVTDHHPLEGLGRLSAARLDVSLAALTDAERVEVLRLLGLESTQQIQPLWPLSEVDSYAAAAAVAATNIQRSLRTGARPRLPPPRTTIGRDAHVEEVIDALAARPPGAAIVLGPPGVGKTNLTLAAMHDGRVVSRYGERRYFVRCEAATSYAEVVSELAIAMGISLAAEDLRGECLRKLQVGPSLVCLDNAETPWAADILNSEELFGQLAEQCTLLMSMRGLESPGVMRNAHYLRLSTLTENDAERLFITVAGDEFDKTGLDELLADMGGLPLAIELLAYAVQGEGGVEALTLRWRSEKAKVGLLKRAAADHPTLNAQLSIEASWHDPLMTWPARRLLSMLSRLPQGVASAYVPALIPDEGADAASVLRRRGLAFDESGRLRTHPLIRHHVASTHPPASADWERAITQFRDVPAGHVIRSASRLTVTPLAIEAHWDGDTAGWGIDLSATIIDANGKPIEEPLGYVRGSNGDFRLFTGEVPPWPDAEVAAWVGRMIADQFGVPFWFPSPIHPEDDCPRFVDRHKATACKQCRVPLIQQDRCPWKGVCYSCHLTLSRNA